MIAVFLLAAILICVVFAHKAYKSTQEAERLKRDLKIMLAQTPQIGTTIPMSHFQQVVGEKEAAIAGLSQNLATVVKSLEELKSQQQSKSVRLGQISEQVLPFHREFPYDYKKLKPMFQPIDYIFFGEEEIVFLELKMGTSQLSESQKNIKRLIAENKVSFVEFRIDEHGVKIK